MFFGVCFFLVSDSVGTRDSYGSVCIIYPLSVAFTSLIWMPWGTVLQETLLSDEGKVLLRLYKSPCSLSHSPGVIIATSQAIVWVNSNDLIATSP